MVVFYYVANDSGKRQIDAINWLTDVIIDPIDISYWAVPGTLED